MSKSEVISFKAYVAICSTKRLWCLLKNYKRCRKPRDKACCNKKIAILRFELFLRLFGLSPALEK
jgi:hypothetical protein